MTNHETVNRRYSELQTQLRLIFAAEGRGLSEMTRAVEQHLSPTLSWELRAIAHIRNKVVHEGLVEIPRYFEPLCKEALGGLKHLKAAMKATVKKAKATTVTKPIPSTPLIPPHLVSRPQIARPTVTPATRPTAAKTVITKPASAKAKSAKSTPAKKSAKVATLRGKIKTRAAS